MASPLRPRAPWPLAFLPLLAACAGAPTATTAAPAEAALDGALLAALETEAHHAASAEPYLALIDRAAASPRAPGALAAVIASVHALAVGGPPTVGELAGVPVAGRARDLHALVAQRLAQAWDRMGAASPAPSGKAGADAYAPLFLRGAVARGAHELALFRGDAAAAATWLARRGCATEAVVLGPLDATPLRALDAPSPVDATALLADTYPGVAPFAAAVAPVVVRADACAVDLGATSPLDGLRAVVVDVESPRPQTIGLALTSSSAAVLEVGGARVARRGFEAGGDAVTRLAAVAVPAGKTRVVVRVAVKGEGDLVELDAWGEDGAPLAMRAPRPGDRAPGQPTGALAIELGEGAAGRGDAGLATAAAALLALGEARAAEHLLEPSLVRPDASPPLALDLLFARAVDLAGDLPDAKRAERVRASAQRALAKAPYAWEARLMSAGQTELRHGPGDGVARALSELGVTAAPDGTLSLKSAIEPDSGHSGTPEGQARMVLAYLALASHRAGLDDVAGQAYAALEAMAPGSPLLAEVDARVHTRHGDDAVRAACWSATSRATTACLDAIVARGDEAAALAEIARLRKLRGAPDALRETEVARHVARGDLAAAVGAYDALPAAQRALLTVPAWIAARGGDARGARLRLERDGLTARDAPYSLAPLASLLGLEASAAAALEAEGERLVREDRASAFLPGAGVAVLRHVERYSLERTGLLRFVFYDLRRVSGTTDVDQGAQTFGPDIDGRYAPRLLRRRIHKRDGRVLEPDTAAHAAQGHADLSQLEQGDYVEQIADGYALPGDSGQLVLDTPDLLPERTSVRDGEIEVRRAASIPLSMWAHPLLGKPEERREGDAIVSVYRLRDASPRRLEDGVPRLEQRVGVSLGTLTWAGIARAIDENLRTFDDRDPFVARWAAEAAGPDRAPSRALVERVVTAVGKAVKIAGGGELSDVAAVWSSGAQYASARTILELGQGSRSWVVYRVLRELGLEAELAIAETEPFSDSPGFPPHAGRFRRPLVRARVPGEPAPIWIDADVEGPPLPPGRVSPELRGRAAMLATGEILTLDAGADGAGDEIDVRLTLDDKGDARGTFTALLHGRAAQGLAEAFETVVGSDRRELLRAVVLGWLPWADVDDVSLSSSAGSWQVALRASITVHGYGRPEGKGGFTWVLPGLEPVHWVFPRAAAGTLGATYTSRGERESALAIGSSLSYHVRRRIELPPGAKVTRAPDPIRVKTGAIAAERRTQATGAVLEDDFTLSLPTGTVAAGDYGAFALQVRAIDDAFLSGTRVERGK
jgi:hypothetical protein